MEKKLGEYMLQGWALMGETCPEGCPCPLVFKRSTGVYKCVQCDQQFSGSPLTNIRPPQQPNTSAPVVITRSSENWSVQASDALKGKLASEAGKLGDVHDQDLVRKMLENINTLIKTIRELEKIQ